MSRSAFLATLARRIRSCAICPGLGGGVPGRGPARAAVLVAGEAPGRFGAGRTGIPFAGDRSGEILERLLPEAGLAREGLFLTNAVHCLPLDERGRNRPPSGRERRACSSHLREEIAAVRPRIVVTLGAVALRAVGEILGRRWSLRDAVRRVQRAGGVRVFPLYHPSPRVLGTARPFREQREDYRALGRALRRLSARRRVR